MILYAYLLQMGDLENVCMFVAYYSCTHMSVLLSLMHSEHLTTSSFYKVCAFVPVIKIVKATLKVIIVITFSCIPYALMQETSCLASARLSRLSYLPYMPHSINIDSLDFLFHPKLQLLQE